MKNRNNLNWKSNKPEVKTNNAKKPRSFIQVVAVKIGEKNIKATKYVANSLVNLGEDEGG